MEKLLRATPKKYAQLKIAIETLLDFQDLTIEEVIRRMKTVDDLDDEPAHKPVSVGGKLMLTEDADRGFCSKAFVHISEPEHTRS